MGTAAVQDPCLTVCSKGSSCSTSGLGTELETVHWEACFRVPNFLTPTTSPSTPVCNSVFQSGKVKGRDHASPHISFLNPSSMDNRFSIERDPTLSFFSPSSGPLKRRLKNRLGRSYSYPPGLRRLVPEGSRASHQHSGDRSVGYSFYASTYGVERLLLCIDNQPTLFAINKLRCNSRPILQELLLLIHILRKHHLSVTALRIASTLNCKADALSHLRETSLPQDLFLSLVEWNKWSNPPQVDLIDSALNTKVLLFYFRLQEPLALAHNALAADGSQWQHIYLFSLCGSSPKQRSSSEPTRMKLSWYFHGPRRSPGF